MNVILGVDPGISGAIAFYYPCDPARVAAEDVPVAGGEIDAVTLARKIAAVRPSVAILESVHSMPRQGVASSFKFGQSFGVVKGVLGALEVPVRLVAPTVWKRYFKLSADKELSRKLALQMFPACAEHFARKKDDGRAEAALIARYGAEALHLLGGAA